MSDQPDALALLEEAAADPACNTLMERCPDNATAEELAELAAFYRAERAGWRAKE